MADHIHLHIDQIILDDIHLSMGQRQQLKAIVEAELTQLLSIGNPPLTKALSSNALPRMAIALPPDHSIEPQHLGQHIAQFIHHQLNDGRVTR